MAVSRAVRYAAAAISELFGWEISGREEQKFLDAIRVLAREIAEKELRRHIRRVKKELEELHDQEED